MMADALKEMLRVLSFYPFHVYQLVNKLEVQYRKFYSQPPQMKHILLNVVTDIHGQDG